MCPLQYSQHQKWLKNKSQLIDPHARHLHGSLLPIVDWGCKKGQVNLQRLRAAKGVAQAKQCVVQWSVKMRILSKTSTKGLRYIFCSSAGFA